MPEADEQIIQRAESLLESVNDSARHVRNVHLTFLLLITYFAIIIGSTTDAQLLKISPVTLPLLNVQLPILAFYVLTPWLLLLLHFNLLLQCYLLARKLHLFKRTVQECNNQLEISLLRDRLFTFALNHVIVEQQHPRLLRLLLRSMMLITVVVLPLVLLTWAQIRFIPYHSEAITWNHRIVVLLDCMLLWMIWPRVLVPAERLGQWWRQAYLRPWHRLRWLASFIKHRETASRPAHTDPLRGQASLLLSSSLLLCVSWLIALVPQNDGVEEQLFLTRVLFNLPGNLFRQNLYIENEILVQGEAPPEIISALQGPFTTEKQNALKKITGLDLQHRNLRRAVLVRCILPKANLLGARLRGVVLIGSQLPEASLRAAELENANMLDSQLQGADLSFAQMQGAELSGVQLQGARLANAQLQGVNLSRGNLQGASLYRAQLQGADLFGTQLQGADLFEAQLQLVNVDDARLQAAGLSGANLQGAFIHNSSLQGTDLSEAQLQGAEWVKSDFTLAKLTGAQTGILTESGTQEILAQLQMIRHKEVMAKIQRLIRERKGKKTAFRSSQAKIAPLCNDPGKPLGLCRGPKETAAYYKQWLDFISGLACGNKDIAKGVSAGYLTRYTTKYFRRIYRVIARRLLDPACQGGAALDAATREHLKNIVAEQD